jgi:hypothetical protein
MAAKIGNRKDAAEVLMHHEGMGVPSEWRRIGSGAFRTAYLHIASGVVYKVENNPTYAAGSDMGNKCEARNARRLAKHAWKHIVIPTVSLFTIGEHFVVAMEYVEGTLGMTYGKHPGPDEWYKVPYRNRVRDMHGGNYIIRSSDNKMVPVDLAS